MHSAALFFKKVSVVPVTFKTGGILFLTGFRSYGISAGFAGLAAQPSRPRPSSPARFKTENRYQNRLLPMNIRPPTTLPGRLGGVLRQLLQE